MTERISISEKRRYVNRIDKNYYYTNVEVESINETVEPNLGNWGTLTKYEIEFIKKLKSLKRVDDLIEEYLSSIDDSLGNKNTSNDLENTIAKKYTGYNLLHNGTKKNKYKYEINWQLITKNLSLFPNDHFNYYYDKINWSYLNDMDFMFEDKKIFNNFSDLREGVKHYNSEKMLNTHALDFDTTELFNDGFTGNLGIIYRKEHWNIISKCANLNLLQMIKHIKHLNFNLISEYQNLEVILKMYNNPQYIESLKMKIPRFNKHDINKLVERKFNWVIISKTRKMDPQMAKKFQNFICWEEIVKNQKMSEFLIV